MTITEPTDFTLTFMPASTPPNTDRDVICTDGNRLWFGYYSSDSKSWFTCIWHLTVTSNVIAWAEAALIEVPF